MPRPPRSTLFPTRRSSDLHGEKLASGRSEVEAHEGEREEPKRLLRFPSQRSEEHTSELQSQSNLVCRLLLEKKKKTTRKLKRVLQLQAHRPRLAMYVENLC